MNDVRLQDLAKLAEFELKKIDDQKREDGWTPWLIYAALAGLVWKFVADLAVEVRWPLVAIVTSCAILLLDFVRDASGALTRPFREFRPGIRVIAANRLLGTTRLFLIVHCFRITSAAYLFWHSAALTGMARVLWLIFFGAQAAGTACLLLVSYADLPLPIGGRKPTRGPRVVALFTQFFQFAAIFVMIRAAGPLLASRSVVPELQVGLIAFAIIELIALLCAHRSDSPSRHALIQIRRAITLEEISAEDAKNRLETAIYGLALDKYLQPYLDAYLMAIAEQTKQQELLLTTLSQANESLERETDASVRAQNAVSVERVAAQASEIDRHLDQVEALRDRFEMRATVASSLNPAAEAELAPLRANMKSHVQTLKDTSAKNSAAIKEYRSRWLARTALGPAANG